MHNAKSWAPKRLLSEVTNPGVATLRVRKGAFDALNKGGLERLGKRNKVVTPSGVPPEELYDYYVNNSKGNKLCNCNCNLAAKLIPQTFIYVIATDAVAQWEQSHTHKIFLSVFLKEVTALDSIKPNAQRLLNNARSLCPSSACLDSFYLTLHSPNSEPPQGSKV